MWRLKRVTLVALASSATTIGLAASPGPPAAAGPVKVIFDTDMYGDIDDALALAMLHALQSRGEIELLAVTVSTESAWAARFIDLVNTFYGRPDIPVGVASDGMTVAALNASPYGPYLPSPEGIHYTQHVASLEGKDGALLFPRDDIDGTGSGGAVGVLRRALAAEPDRSVVVICVGYMTNLAQLLESGPDDASQLDGRALVRQKVSLLSAMAGNFATAARGGEGRRTGSPEFNLVLDESAARAVFGKWPAPIVASGSEVGASLLFPQSAIDRYFNYVGHHPIAEAYRYAAAFYRRFSSKPGSAHDHATYDLTSVLYAARPQADYFTLSGAGEVAVGDGGRSLFTPLEGGTRRFLGLPDARRMRALEAMIMLASQPPVSITAR
jgi:inosine-uridine nucleoside N-ribohydrolase